MDHWLSHKFPRSESHGPPGYDDTIVQILQAYIFTELEIQVKVIVQILSALELESKRERGWAYNGPRQNRPQLILWRWFYCGLLRPGYEGKPLHDRKRYQSTCSRRSMSWLSVTLPLSCPLCAIPKSIVSICLDRSGLTREIRATDMGNSASVQLVACGFVTAHVFLGHQHPARWPIDLA